MRSWAILVGALIVWAAHFFAVYIAASVFPGTGTARVLALAITVAAAMANIAILWWIRHPPAEPLDRWTVQLGSIAALVSLVAVLWQGLPAILI